MRVNHLSLTDFRSYRSADVSFSPGVNVLVGPNGIGKTNIAEAIRFSSTLSSHRVASDAPLCRSGATSAVIRTSIQRSDQQRRLEIAVNVGRANQLQVNGGALRPKEFVGLLRTVMFGPEDLRIVKGDPSDRRDFVDELLVQRAPRYLGVKADYDRVVKQRTTLIKTIGLAKSAAARSAALQTLDVWNEQLAELGAALTYGRLRLLAETAGPTAAAYCDISAGSGSSLRYLARSLDQSFADEVPSVADLTQLLSAATMTMQEAEITRGVTLVGPHRDDVMLEINGLPARTHSSHGESWSLALALRLGAFDVLRGMGDDGGDPVLILDDVFAELDSTRRDALSKVAQDAEQVFVTAAVEHDVPEFDGAVYYAVTPGEVHRRDS